MPANKKLRPEIGKIARDKLGFETLRPGQKEAVEAILEGCDTLVVQPTGSGKSAIYQIAGLLIDGATVVVSPLIALQKDQLDSIEQQDTAYAAVLNSTQRATEIREQMQRLRRGKIEYILLAPEQLRKTETLENLKEAGISLFVVDEAHCISEWGHDFRPDYLRLGHVIEALGHPRVLSLTATASPLVRQEIVERLHMRRPKIFVRGFDRPNIYLRVDRFESEQEKRDALIHRVRWADKPGIVYVGTRKIAQEVMQALAAEGVESVFYHGGLKRREREDIQNRFMSGEAEVIVATNAFGMGIDKPNVRFVYHYDAPDSLDSYYQEIGRAGRDGKRSDAVLFFREKDIGAQSFKTGEGKIEPAALEQLTASLAEANGPVAPDTLAGEAGLSRRKLTSALQRLEDVGAAEMLENGEVQPAEGANLEEAAKAAAQEQERRRQAKRERLQQVRTYAELTTCRREFLLQYLGDSYEGPCSFCDNCEVTPTTVAFDPDAGTRREVVH